METESDNILSDDFELIGPIQARPRHQTPFGLGDTNIGSQYNNCLSGGARGKVLVYHLVHKSSATPVGFIGLEMATEELDAGDPVNAFVSVEYVYLAPRLRGHHLSRFFRHFAATQAKTWIDSLIESHGPQGVTCLSASAPVSAAGLQFVEKLAHELRNYCRNRGVAFLPEISLADRSDELDCLVEELPTATQDIDIHRQAQELQRLLQ